MIKKEYPLVTVVTPSYNQGQYIEETILSVLNQTYKNIQYIVVDGGSSDNTMQVIERYRNKIDIVIHEIDNGQTDAINKGFKLAKGELVGWINSDDILYADCVKKIVELYNKNNDGAIYYSCFNDFIDGTGKLLTTYKMLIKSRDYLLNKNYSIIQQASFYNTGIVKQVGYLDVSIHYCMDMDLWLKLLKYGPIYAFNERPLSAFRLWGETKTTKGRYRFLRETRKILIKNGASWFSQNIARTYWREFKGHIKQILLKLQN